jgi:adenine phosphoribosyltransferase
MTTQTRDTLVAQIRAAIRDIHDFPQPGIVFKDITPLLANASLFRQTTSAMAAPFQQAGVTHVAAIESRGFLLGAPIAMELSAALIPIRKPGKLPFETASIEYALEYGTDRLEVHCDACDMNARVLIVDDVLATGGTAAAAGQLIRGLGATVVGFSFLIALSFLNGVARLDGATVERVVEY